MPFLVTFADYDLRNTFYEWDVNPLTRIPIIPQEDVEEITEKIVEAPGIVFQNPKFDVTGLLNILPKGFVWPWHKTYDTLMGGHLLASNHPHDLTSMGVEYLGVDLGKYEKPMEIAVKRCRSLVTRKDSPISDWRIAKKGLPEMPSAGEKVWKYDLWILQAVAKWVTEVVEEDCYDLTWDANLTSDYANSDSVATMAIFKVMVKLLKERNLWEIYLERLKVLKSVHTSERVGITLNRTRLYSLRDQYREEETKSRNVCVNIAKTFGYDLKLPKSGNNKNLTKFVFEAIKLPVLASSKKTGAPSLNAKVLEEYEATLPARSRELRFAKALKEVRQRSTALGYMEGYEKLWIAVPGFEGWYVLHPSLNPTGSDTLRFSSSNPNEQNISKKEGFNLRYLFGPVPGREWWSLDYKNQELRIPAYEAQEPLLIDLFERSDEPPYYGSNHLLNFSTIYPDLWNRELKSVGLEKVGQRCKNKYAATWYQRCKNGGFAVQYGAVERDDGEGTADKAFHKPGAQAMLKKRLPKLEALNQAQIEYADRYGYVTTLPDRTVNSKQGYPLLCSRGQWGKVKPTIPLNYHVQGTACWVVMRAMIKIQKFLDQLNRKEETYFMVMQIHDEVVLDFPHKPDKGNLPKVEVVQSLMSSIGEDLVPVVPLPVGIEYHPDNWSEGETVE